MIKKVLRNCNVCNREYSYDSRQKNAKYCSEKCRGVFNRQKNIKGDEFIDYVFCQICFLKFKEINNDHLLLHNISSNEYDILYNTPRTSEKTKIKKNTLTSIMNDDFSKKLSYSHSLNGYKEKYGEIEGVIKYNEMIKNKKYKNGFNYYKDKYGKEAEFKYKEVQNKKGSSLKNYIIKYGKTEGKIKYNVLIKKRKYLNSLFGYIDKNGFEIGLQKWMKKNNKISISNSIIKKEEKKDFLLYIKEVNIYTGILISFLINGLGTNGVNIATAVIQVGTFMVKFFMMAFVYMWVRWTVLRIRYDQLQMLGWKVLIPLALLNIVITAIVVVLGN